MHLTSRLLLGVTLASALGAATPGVAFAEQASAPLTTTVHPAPKSPATARWIASSVTLVGAASLTAGVFILPGYDSDGVDRTAGAMIGVGLAAALVGPGAGHLYVSEPRSALGYGVARTLLTLTAFVVTMSGCAGGGAGDGDGESTADRDHRRGCLVAAAVGGTMLGGAAALTVYQIVDAGRAARRYNARARASAGISATVVPTIDPQRGGGGLALVGGF